jgi:hypothetical protein
MFLLLAGLNFLFVTGEETSKTLDPCTYSLHIICLCINLRVTCLDVLVIYSKFANMHKKQNTHMAL